MLTRGRESQPQPESHLLGSLICVLISRNATVGMWRLHKDEECTRVCVCVCDLPWLQVSWLVRNDRLALSCSPHPPGPPHSPTPPTHLLWKHARSLNPSCVYTVWALVCACVSQFSFVTVAWVGPVGELKKILIMLCHSSFFCFCECQGPVAFVFKHIVSKTEAVLHGT